MLFFEGLDLHTRVRSNEAGGNGNGEGDNGDGEGDEGDSGEDKESGDQDPIVKYVKAILEGTEVPEDERALSHYNIRDLKQMIVCRGYPGSVADEDQEFEQSDPSVETILYILQTVPIYVLNHCSPSHRNRHH